MAALDERITVRNRKQITIPKAVADARNIREGQPLIVHIDDEHPQEIVLRILPESYAGSLTEVFASVDSSAFVQSERAGWE